MRRIAWARFASGGSSSSSSSSSSVLLGVPWLGGKSSGPLAGSSGPTQHFGELEGPVHGKGFSEGAWFKSECEFVILSKLGMSELLSAEGGVGYSAGCGGG